MAKNPLRADPTRTFLIRRAFEAEMKRRFRALSDAVFKALVIDDAFGLVPRESLSLNIQFQEFAFKQSPEKLAAFNHFVQEQTDAGILQVKTDPEGRWPNQYLESAYKKGRWNAYLATEKANGGKAPMLGYRGSRNDFLESSFLQPESASKVQFIYARAYEELKGVTSAMGQQMSRTFATGLTNGYGARKMASELRKNVEGITKRRAMVLARTETIAAHAEGALDSYEQFGIQEVKPLAEWSTAGDDLVCPLCLPLEGVILTISEARGAIPRHPNCLISPKVKIYTAKGWRPIGEIAVGDMVLTHRGRFKKVIETHKNKAENVKVISFAIRETDADFEIKLTENHPVMVNGEWVAAKEIQAGAKVTWLASRCKHCGIPVPFGFTSCGTRCSMRATGWTPDYSGDFFFSEFGVVKRSEYEKKKVTLYNLSVEEDESYLAKGCVVHNCRCSWLPAFDDLKEKGQKWKPSQIRDAIRKSVKAQLPKSATSKEVTQKTKEVISAPPVVEPTNPKLVSPAQEAQKAATRAQEGLGGPVVEGGEKVALQPAVAASGPVSPAPAQKVPAIQKPFTGKAPKTPKLKPPVLSRPVDVVKVAAQDAKKAINDAAEKVKLFEAGKISKAEVDAAVKLAREKVEVHSALVGTKKVTPPAAPAPKPPKIKKVISTKSPGAKKLGLSKKVDALKVAEAESKAALAEANKKVTLFAQGKISKAEADAAIKAANEKAKILERIAGRER